MNSCLTPAGQRFHHAVPDRGDSEFSSEAAEEAVHQSDVTQWSAHHWVLERFHGHCGRRPRPTWEDTGIRAWHYLGSAGWGHHALPAVGWADDKSKHHIDSECFETRRGANVLTRGLHLSLKLNRDARSGAGVRSCIRYFCYGALLQRLGKSDMWLKWNKYNVNW